MYVRKSGQELEVEHELSAFRQQPPPRYMLKKPVNRIIVEDGKVCGIESPGENEDGSPAEGKVEVTVDRSESRAVRCTCGCAL